MKHICAVTTLATAHTEAARNLLPCALSTPTAAWSPPSELPHRCSGGRQRAYGRGAGSGLLGAYLPELVSISVEEPVAHLYERKENCRKVLIPVRSTLTALTLTVTNRDTYLLVTGGGDAGLCLLLSSVLVLRLPEPSFTKEALVQLQLVTGLLPAHAALHMQTVDVDRDVLDVLRGNPGPSSNSRGTVRNPKTAAESPHCKVGLG